MEGGEKGAWCREVSGHRGESVDKDAVVRVGKVDGHLIGCPSEMPRVVQLQEVLSDTSANQYDD